MPINVVSLLDILFIAIASWIALSLPIGLLMGRIIRIAGRSLLEPVPGHGFSQMGLSTNRSRALVSARPTPDLATSLSAQTRKRAHPVGEHPRD